MPGKCKLNLLQFEDITRVIITRAGEPLTEMLAGGFRHDPGRIVPVGPPLPLIWTLREGTTVRVAWQVSDRLGRGSRGDRAFILEHPEHFDEFPDPGEATPGNSL
jgi:hypothetical protein